MLRFIFQFRLSFVLKSSIWMTTNPGVQLVYQRAGLPIQGDEDSPGKQANGNLMKSNRDKSEAPDLGKKNPLWQRRLGTAGPGAALPKEPGGSAGWARASGAAKWATASRAVWRTSQTGDGRSLLQRCVVGEQQPWARIGAGKVVTGPKWDGGEVSVRTTQQWDRGQENMCRFLSPDWAKPRATWTELVVGPALSRRLG